MPSRNDLECILAARNFGPQLYPELFRLLRESTLVFLLPYHPELKGSTITVGRGDRLPKFVVWESASEGRRIPVFSSPNCANEACKRVGARDGQYALAEMQGKELFALLACQQNPIVINPACGTNATFLDINAVKKLADGSILTPEEGDRKLGTVQIVDPADYPTGFLQPLFGFLRERPQVKAAWLFREVSRPGAPASYVFVLKTTGDSSAVERDFRVVANSACPEDAEYGVTLFDPNNAQLVQATSRFTPFYAAPDYPAPSPLQDDAPGKA
jgi:hypothetical protein